MTLFGIKEVRAQDEQPAAEGGETQQINKIPFADLKNLLLQLEEAKQTGNTELINQLRNRNIREFMEAELAPLAGLGYD